MIFLGVRLWNLNHRDPCQALMPGNTLPTTVLVDTGTRTVEMPCNVWLPRQPELLQLACLLDVTVFTVFLLSVWRDINHRSHQRHHHTN